MASIDFNLSDLEDAFKEDHLPVQASSLPPDDQHRDRASSSPPRAAAPASSFRAESERAFQSAKDLICSHVVSAVNESEVRVVAALQRSEAEIRDEVRGVGAAVGTMAVKLDGCTDEVARRVEDVVRQVLHEKFPPRESKKPKPRSEAAGSREGTAKAPKEKKLPRHALFAASLRANRPDDVSTDDIDKVARALLVETKSKAEPDPLCDELWAGALDPKYTGLHRKVLGPKPKKEERCKNGRSERAWLEVLLDQLQHQHHSEESKKRSEALLQSSLKKTKRQRIH
jgi:hypothetical protein